MKKDGDKAQTPFKVQDGGIELLIIRTIVYILCRNNGQGSPDRGAIFIFQKPGNGYRTVIEYILCNLRNIQSYPYITGSTLQLYDCPVVAADGIVNVAHLDTIVTFNIIVFGAGHRQGTNGQDGH